MNKLFEKIYKDSNPLREGSNYELDFPGKGKIVKKIERLFRRGTYDRADAIVALEEAGIPTDFAEDMAGEWEWDEQ